MSECKTSKNLGRINSGQVLAVTYNYVKPDLTGFDQVTASRIEEKSKVDFKLDGDLLAVFFDQETKDGQPMFGKWVIAEESVSLDHYQCCVRADSVGKDMRLDNLAKLMQERFKGIHLSFVAKKNEDAAFEYCKKTRFGKNCRLRASKNVYIGQDLPDHLYPWQMYLVELMKTMPDDRTVHLFLDPDGGVGKSKLGKYLSFWHDCLYVTYGDSKHLLNLVSKNMGKRAYVFDLSRCKPKDYARKDIWATIESIKNGFVVNLHYESSSHLMSPPWVFVFANTLEPADLNSLSKDRWRIHSIRRPDLIAVPYRFPNQKPDHPVSETQFVLNPKLELLECKQHRN